MLRSYEDELRENRKVGNYQRNRDLDNMSKGLIRDKPNTSSGHFEHSSSVITFPGREDFDNGKMGQNKGFKSKNDTRKGSDNTSNRENFREPTGIYQYGSPINSGYPGPPPRIPPNYPPYLPPHYPKRPVEPFGITAATLGIVSMCIFWLSAFPYFFGTIMYIIILSISVLGIIFGAYSYANRARRTISGLVGLILSIIAIVLSSTVWSFSHLNYGYYYEMIYLLFL